MGRNRFERRVRGIIPTTWDDDPVVPSLELLENPFGVDKPGGHDMSIYLPPSVRHFYPRHLVFSTWADHIQFGYDLVAAQKPELLVELGTQGGLSYFAFCQSVQENDLSTTCYAVDTWEGEEHTGKYDESTWELVSDVNRLSYSGFSHHADVLQGSPRPLRGREHRSAAHRRPAHLRRGRRGLHDLVPEGQARRHHPVPRHQGPHEGLPGSGVSGTS